MRCKGKSETNDIEIVTLKNGKLAEKGTCVICGSKKSKLVTSRASLHSEVTGGDIVGVINSVTKHFKLPGQRFTGEMHYPGANFMGPGTRLDLRLNANS